AEVADRGEQRGKGEIAAEHVGAKVDAGDSDGLARPERDVLKHPTVLAQRDLVVGASVDIVEYNPGEAAPGPEAQVLDIDHVRRSQRRRAPDQGSPGLGGRIALRGLARFGRDRGMTLAVSGFHAWASRLLFERGYRAAR